MLAAIETRGTRRVAALLQLERETITRLGAGLPVRHASLMLARAHLPRLDADEGPTP